MIVPNRRLLVCYGLAIPVLTLLQVPGWIGFATVVGMCLVFGMAALFDCVLAYVSSQAIAVDLPGLVRMTKDRESAIDINVRRVRGSRQSVVRLGLPFPEQIFSLHEAYAVRLPRGVVSSSA